MITLLYQTENQSYKPKKQGTMKTLKANYAKAQESFTNGLVRFCRIHRTNHPGAFLMLPIIAIS